MPEIAPSPPPRGRNIDRCTRCRSMVMQAWGNYGTLWPVVHQQLGVRPDAGRSRLAVVPQVPDGQRSVAGENIRLGTGALDGVEASRTAGRRSSRRRGGDGTTVYRTAVDTGSAPVRRLTIGHTLPHGTEPKSVRLDGRRTDYRRVDTNRGAEILVNTSPGRHTLVVRAR
jgi:hypothetical protein